VDQGHWGQLLHAGRRAGVAGAGGMAGSAARCMGQKWRVESGGNGRRNGATEMIYVYIYCIYIYETIVLGCYIND